MKPLAHKEAPNSGGMDAPKMKTVTCRGRSEDDAVKPPRPRRVLGLPDPVARRGRRHAPVLPIPDVQGREHNQVAECRGPAEEVSTTVAVQGGEGEEAEAARGCRSRRSRDDGGGDEVVLDEA